MSTPIFLVAAVVAVLAQSPQNPPTHDAAASESQQQPPVVQSEQSAPQLQRSTNDNADISQKALVWSAVVQAVAAVVVMGFTGALLFYSHRGWQVAKVSADAAKMSADTATTALNMAHRPTLVVRHVVAEGIDRNGHVGSELTNGYVLVTNVGVLPATLLKVYAEWLFAETLPVENPALKALDHSTTPVIMQPASFLRIPLPDREIAPEEYSSINNAVEGIRVFGVHEGALFLVGYIKYSDVIGLRRTYFCYQYNPSLHYFTAVDHPSYSYED